MWTKLLSVSALVAVVMGASQPMDKTSLAEVADFIARHPDMEDNTVNMNPGDYANCSRSRPLELYILQDGTSTFRSLLTQVQKVLPTVVDNLAVEFLDFRGGLTTFTDRPTTTVPNIPCYRQDLPMTDDIAAFRKACASVSFLAGTSNGYAENSIETLAFAAGSHAGFSKPAERPDAIRIAIVITDTWGRLMTSPPGPANPNLRNEMICEIGADFPPLWQVSEILREANVYPLAVITETYTSSLMHWWKMVLFDDENDRMALPKETGLVVPFDMNAESMVNAIHAGVLALDCQLEEYIDTSTTEPPTLPTTVSTQPTTVNPTAVPTTVPSSAATETPAPTEATEKEGDNTVVLISAAVAGAAVLGAAAGVTYYFSTGSPPDLEVEMEGEGGDHDDDDAPREMADRATSQDFA